MCHQGNYQVENILLFSSSSGFFFCSPHYRVFLGKHAGSTEVLRATSQENIGILSKLTRKPLGSTKSSCLFSAVCQQGFAPLFIPRSPWELEATASVSLANLLRAECLPDSRRQSSPNHFSFFLSSFIFHLMKQRAKFQVRKIQPTNSALFKQTFHSRRLYLCSHLSLFWSGNCLFLLLL